MPDNKRPAGNPDKKRKKGSAFVTAFYVVGIALAAGSYVFAEASGFLIPGLSPFALTAVILMFARQYYLENRENKTGMLKPQLAIILLLAAINFISGVLQIIAAISAAISAATGG